MDLRFSEEYEAFRRELRGFLEASWPLRGDEEALPRDRQERLFRQRATEAGYYARGATAAPSSLPTC